MRFLRFSAIALVLAVLFGSLSRAFSWFVLGDHSPIHEASYWMGVWTSAGASTVMSQYFFSPKFFSSKKDAA